eukprot:1814227-Rhodomonas_salina.1
MLLLHPGEQLSNPAAVGDRISANSVPVRPNAPSTPASAHSRTPASLPSGFPAAHNAAASGNSAGSLSHSAVLNSEARQHRELRCQRTTDSGSCAACLRRVASPAARVGQRVPHRPTNIVCDEEQGRVNFGRPAGGDACSVR